MNPGFTERHRFFSKKRVFILCICFFLILTALYLIRPLGNSSTASSDDHSDVLGNDQIMVQPLTVSNPLSAISFKIGTLLQEYDDATLRVQITDAVTGETVYTCNYDSSQLKDNCTLTLDTYLGKGEYLLSFDLDHLAEGQGMVLYTTTQTNRKCSVDGVEKDYAVFLTAKSHYEISDVRNVGIGIAIIFFVLLAGSLLFTGIHSFQKGPASGRNKIILKYTAAFLCLTAALLLITFEFVRMLDSGSVTVFQNKRLLFYIVVLLIACFEWLVSEEHSWIGYLFVILWSLAWIFTDLQYNVIDEKAHTDIIRYILENNCSYPTVQQNYEAVQGPIYYYVIALLFGWMPVQSLYIGARIFGLLMLILLERFTKKTILAVREAGMIKAPDRLINLFILLFIFNPNIVIRLTRVSNESLMCVLTAAAVYEFTKMMINEYDRKKLYGITILCALSFLTKATSVFIFGLVFLICAYHKKWPDFFKQVLVYAVIVAPWFISNYMTYGALTGMKAHTEYVLPILNPNYERPDIWHGVLNYFYSYFQNAEC